MTGTSRNRPLLERWPKTKHKDRLILIAGGRSNYPAELGVSVNMAVREAMLDKVSQEPVVQSYCAYVSPARAELSSHFARSLMWTASPMGVDVDCWPPCC